MSSRSNFARVLALLATSLCTVRRHLAWMVLPLCGACDVTPSRPAPDLAWGETACGRGVVVVSSSDYTSTTVSLLDPDGVVRAPSALSSNDRAAALTAALSGDVVLPTMPTQDDEVVIIDREAAVLTWLDVTNGSQRQLSVATGFASNPHDYVPGAATTALIPRFHQNLREPEVDFDRGNDLLVVDPEEPEIIGSIDLGPTVADEAPGIRPSADRAVRLGTRTFVTAPSFDRTYEAPAASRLVVVDDVEETIEQVLVFPGARGCSSLAASPSGATLAISCTGRYRNDATLDESLLLVVDVRQEARVTHTFPAASFGQGQLAGGIAFADEGTLLFTTSGATDDTFQPSGNDALHALRIDAESCPEPECLSDADAGAAHRVLAESAPFSLGSAACHTGCGRCYVADAAEPGSAGRLLIVERTAGAWSVVREASVDDGVGLPPRHVGLF